MKERAQPKPQQPTIVKPRIIRGGKKWLKVLSGTHPNDLKSFNSNIEHKYHRVLKAIKDLYLEAGTQYFERDYKYDFTESLALHSFACDQVYLHLECDYHCDMRIEYDFQNFPHEEAVLKLLHYPISRGSAFHKPQQPDMAAFFKRVVAYQDPKYIHNL